MSASWSSVGLFDTNIVILLPRISAVTLAELTVGPLVASTEAERAARQAHLQQAEADFDPIPFDAAAARAFDAMIAATAIANGPPLCTSDPGGYAGIETSSWCRSHTRTRRHDELPRRGFGFRLGMAKRELADSTRAWWVLSVARASGYRYAVSVYRGVTWAVWEIIPGSWRQASPATASRLGASPKRNAFDVRPASPEIRDAFVGAAGKRVPAGVFGSGSVIAYWR